MGLDSFSSDEQESNGGTQDTAEDDEETTSEPELTGLDSFKTDTSRGGSGKENESGNEDELIHGLPPRKWAAMSVDERVSYVRENEISDFYPSHQPDDRWSYRRAVEIRCVCDNTFTFCEGGYCSSCGRKYEDAGRTVVKTYEPEEDKDNA